MTEPSPTPPAPDKSQQWLDVLKAYEPIVLRFAIALGTAVTLATTVYNGCHGAKQDTVDALHADVRSAKDVTVDTNNTQKAVVKGTEEVAKYQFGANAPPVKAIEAATRPATRP